MDPLELTRPEFWSDPAPFAAGEFPGDPADIDGLEGHVLFQTSGSTGEPRWIALSKCALQVSAGAVNRHLDVTGASCWGLALPTHHVGGFGVAARAFEAGCAMACFPGRWNALEFVNWLDERQVTHVSLVPAQVHDLVAGGMPAPACLRAVVVGGGRLDTAAGLAARALGWPVLASYGMTEAGSQIATQPLAALHDIYQESPVPILSIWRIRPGRRQRLQIAGPALFSGSLERVDGGWCFRPRKSDWFQTGDRVMLENDALTPLGRVDAMVKVLGELVDPLAVESELMDLAPGLKPGSFVVVPLPEARAGHVLVPVFDAGVDAQLIKEVLARYAETAPGFRRLRDPVMLADFPRSSLDKPLRRRCLVMLQTMMSGGAGGG